MQFLVVQQKYQDRESDGQADSQGQIATILRPYMAKSKSDAAFLSLLRYEHSPELVEQIHKSRNKTYSQPHRGDKIPESATEHSPQHQNPRSSDQHYGKTGFRHGRQQQIYCKQNIISLMLSDRIWLLIHRQQFTILKNARIANGRAAI